MLLEIGFAEGCDVLLLLQRCKSSSESINEDEDIGEVLVMRTPDKDIKKIDEEEEPESPTTPCSVARPLVLECPDAPCGRWELVLCLFWTVFSQGVGMNRVLRVIVLCFYYCA